ncbi:MAG TPA: hypothetical protein VK627_10875 [Edaphobacter sp.]|nr:hypothetical protein [Edaphobacter sp.]
MNGAPGDMLCSGEEAEAKYRDLSTVAASALPSVEMTLFSGGLESGEGNGNGNSKMKGVRPGG